MTWRILHVSDTHLAPEAPYADDNWTAVSAHVAATRPDLLVHTGDISLDGAHREEHLRHARRLLDGLAVPWRAIPGNHDEGDVAASSDPVDGERAERYRRHLGDASWTVVLAPWRLVGVDIQLLASDLPSAGDHWDWLAEALATDAPTVLFLHRPLFPLAPTDADAPVRYVGEPHRSRLHALVASSAVRLVACGHVHQWRHANVDGRAHVWAPSTWAWLPDRVQPVLGTKVVGVVKHELHDDGRVTSGLLHVAGIAQVAIHDDFVSPYGDH